MYFRSKNKKNESSNFSNFSLFKFDNAKKVHKVDENWRINARYLVVNLNRDWIQCDDGDILHIQLGQCSKEVRFASFCCFKYDFWRIVYIQFQFAATLHLKCKSKLLQ